MKTSYGSNVLYHSIETAVELFYNISYSLRMSKIIILE